MGSRAEVNRGPGHGEQVCREGKGVRRPSVPSLLELGLPSQCLHFCPCEWQLGWAVCLSFVAVKEKDPQAAQAAVPPCCTPPVGAIPMV